VLELLVVRHGIAEDREEFATTGQSDDLRPLTKRGRARMREAARGLASLLDPPEFLATSPYTRAAETAAILAKVFGGPDPLPVDVLIPDGEYEALATWLRGRGPDARITVVGHEPHLSGFVTYLLGARGSVVQLKKGAACLVHAAPSVTPGSGMLIWSLTPGQLRRLGK
jgi:phosphohistidine phosphatase